MKFIVKRKEGMEMKRTIVFLSIGLLSVFLVINAVSAADLPKVIKIGGQGVTSGAHADYGRQMIMGSTHGSATTGAILASRIPPRTITTSARFRRLETPR